MYLVGGIILLPIAIFFLDKKTFTENPFTFLPLPTPIVLTLWVYFGTYYKIENKELVYRSAFFRGKIDIQSVKEIINGKTMWSGTKPATGRNGLIVKYNKYDEVYITPENKDAMISDLLSINAKIKITEYPGTV